MAVSEGLGRLCLVTQWFPPEPAQLAEWLARSLAGQGWAVSILTGIPNYPEGKVYPGYRAFQLRRETVSGLAVRRTPLYPSHDSSAVRRMGNYVSWALSATIWGLGALRRSDVSLVYSSPATAALPAMVARVLFRKPYVLMIQDLWPDSIFASGFLTTGLPSRMARAVLGGFAQLSYKLSSGIAVISPGMREQLLQRGVDAGKLQLVYNWVDEALYHPAEPDRALRPLLGIGPDDFVMMYAGNHGAAQDLANVLRAMELVDSDRVVHLVLVGDGVEKPELEKQAEGMAPGTVHFMPPQPPEAMAPLMAAADLQLVTLKDDPLFRITMPSKVQSILASGRPLLVCAPGDAARVARDAGAGFSCEPGEPNRLADTIHRALQCSQGELERMGDKAVCYYESYMAESIGAVRLTSLLSAAIRSNHLDGQEHGD